MAQRELERARHDVAGGPGKPSDSASLIACRSMARLAARRTRRSCQGDFGSHCSGKSSQKTPLAARRAASVRPGVRRTSSAIGPVQEVGDVHLARLSAAARVDSSGMLRMTRRLTRGRLAPVAVEGLEHQLDARV